MKPVSVVFVIVLGLLFVPPWLGAPDRAGVAAPVEGAMTFDAAPLDAALFSAGSFDAAAVLEADRRRITRHLAAAERLLRAADVSHLDDARRRARAAAIGYLREYRERAEYPHNHDFADATPYFVDERGVHCAMAYLIARSGATDLVARVAATANNAYVRELAADPGLIEWLDRNGMTAAEAAMVQPMYGWTPPETAPAPSLLDDARRHYGAVGTATLAADALALYFMTRGGRLETAGGFAGVVLGTAGVVFGASVLEHGGSRGQEALAIANLGLGVTAVSFGVRSLLRAGGPEPAPDRTAADGAARAAAGPSLELAPAVVPGAGLRPGLALSLRF